MLEKMNPVDIGVKENQGEKSYCNYAELLAKRVKVYF
jgi:hypothetical protein